MNHFKRSITLLLFVVCLFPAPALALVSSGFGKTKAEAVAEAKRNVLQASLSQWLSVEEFKKKQESLDKNILQDMDAYLEGPEILSEKQEKEGVRVTINVEVKTDKLRKILAEKEGWVASMEGENRVALFLKKTSRSHLSGGSREARYAYAEFKGVLEDEYGYEVIRNSLMEGGGDGSRGARRSRSGFRSMELDDALEMASDLGAGYAILFDLKIEMKRENRMHTATALATIFIHDARTKQMVESFEVEGDAEGVARARGRSSERDESILDAIAMVMEQAAAKAHSVLSPFLGGKPMRPVKYEVAMKNFTGEEIRLLVEKFTSTEGFSRVKPLAQTARSYETEISANLNRDGFFKAFREILDQAGHKYNFNFKGNNAHVTKIRIRKEGEPEEGLVDL